MRPLTEMSPDELRRLNSATQYPSILTYHAMGERGRLTEERTTTFADVAVEVTEKIDGTNARIVVPPVVLGRALIGSRTELLHHLGDVVANPAQGIVDAVRHTAYTTGDLLAAADEVVVLFGEVYGGKTAAGAKNYSTAGATGFRIFDLARVPLEVLDRDPADIATWRDGGGQRFVGTAELVGFATQLGLDTVPRLEASAPPDSVAATQQWLVEVVTASLAVLDGSGLGRPEGVVVRTPDRGRIAKIRFEDYARTAKATARASR